MSTLIFHKKKGGKQEKKRRRIHFEFWVIEKLSAFEFFVSFILFPAMDIFFFLFYFRIVKRSAVMGSGIEEQTKYPDRFFLVVGFL